jgi:hypothetical protein
MPKIGNTSTPSGGGPSEDFYAITPNDSTDLAVAIRSIYVGGAGNVVLRNAAGTSITFTGVVAGQILPIAATRVMTASTATLMIGLV